MLVITTVFGKNNDLCTSFLYKKLRIVTFSYKKDTNPQKKNSLQKTLKNVTFSLEKVRNHFPFKTLL